MRTTIDRAGRIVIPKQIRRQAGLGPGATVEVHFHDNRIEIEPVPAETVLVPEGRALVLHFPNVTEPVPADIVEQVREEIERARFGI